MVEVEGEIREALDYLVEQAQIIRQEIIDKLEREEQDPVYAWFCSPTYLATYQLQHSMNYLVLNMNLPTLAAHAARYAYEHGKETYG